MIIVFHCLYMVTKTCLNHINQSSQQILIEIKTTSQASEPLDAEENLSFDPPVYKQRYGEVQLALLNNKWSKDIKKVVDFGCAEFKLFLFIKHLYRINDLLEVDVDEDILKTNIFRVRPLITDYISRRTEPLNIHILKGSISYPDERLINTDAVIGIEIIEHLYPDVLEALPYNVFAFIKPKIAIFTTPNADFNVLFRNFQRFRHYDHKFEWTREQFESWALNITTRFPNYSVSFKGIGNGPESTEHLGCCSQMSIFVKEFDLEECDYNNKSKSSYGICTYLNLSNGFSVSTENDYQLIELVEYPYEIDDRTPQQKICDELKYKINLLSNINGRFYNNELFRFEIPIEELIFNQHSYFTTSAEARTILKEVGYKIEECIICDKLETCVVCEPDMESRSSTPASNTSDVNVPKQYYTEWNRTNSEPEWGIDKDEDCWILDTANQEHEEAMIYANEIVHNIINNIDLSCTYETNSESDKGKNKKNIESSKLVAPCLSNTNSISPIQSVSNVIVDKPKDDNTSIKSLKKDVSCPGISDMKKKKKVKKDVQNGIANEIVLNEEVNEDNQIQQLCMDMIPEPIEQVVENGDLANNNRDLEGNNYPNALEQNVDIRENDNRINDQDLQDNANEEEARNNDVENRNDVDEEVIDQNPVPEVRNEPEMEIEFASREALFDPNSQVDLLEEFDISAEGDPNNSLVELPILQNIVFVGVDPNEEDADSQIAAVLPINAEPFPNWLLNLLGAGVPEDTETHDEPHFYCQGDGLGVHPSFIEEEFDEESTSSDSSDSTTTAGTSHDEAEADPSVSELDIGSLPDDVTEPSVEQTSNAHTVSSIPEEPESSSNNDAEQSLVPDNRDEFFDSVEETLNNSNSQKRITEKDSKT